MTILAPASVVPPNNSTTEGVGMVYITTTFTTLPVDIQAANAVFLNSLAMNARIVHDVPSSTGGFMFGPALRNATSNQTLLTLTQGNQSYYIHNATINPAIASVMFDALAKDEAYLVVDSAKYPFGEIRGNLLTTCETKRRQIADRIFVTAGTISGSLDVTLRASLTGTLFRKNSYVGFLPSNSSGFSMVFTFQLPISKKNTNLIRGLTMDLNLRTLDGAVWLFEWYNAVSQTWITAGSFQQTNWTFGFVNYFAKDVANLVDINGGVSVRVSNPTAKTPLYVDQFTIQPWVPKEATNSIMRAVLKDLRALLGF